MMKPLLKIHAKSLSDALAPSKKNCLRCWPLAALRGVRIYSWSAHIVSYFGQKGWLHTEGTAQVSEWLNISDNAKKLY